MQVHCIGCHLQVPAVLNNVDECFHKVGVVQLVVTADLVDVFLVKFLDTVVVLDTVQEFVDAKLGVEHNVVALVDQTADLNSLLGFLISSVTFHNAVFGFGNTDGNREVVQRENLVFQCIAAGSNFFAQFLIRLVVFEDESGAVGKLGVQNALKMFAEELERVIENLVIVFFDVFAVLFAADVEVLNLEVIDIDNDGGVEFFAQIPAINLAALDNLLEALDIVEDNVLNKTVTVARLDFHVGNIFLRNQL